LIQGTVIKSTGSWYIVRRTDTQEIVKCRIVGKFRLDNMVLTNPVAVGDIVQFVLESEGNGMIKKIMTRTNYVARQSPRRKHDVHLLAANIDQALLFVTVVEPSLKQGFIDRFLLTTEPQEIPTVIAFNKADLYDEEAMVIFEKMKAIYEKVGYTVLLISATEGIGLEALVEVLKNKITMISGQSGVGKSSVVNGIQPKLDLKTGEISDYSGKGQHTTTFAEMHPLDFGGYLIDTPGIKMLAFNNLEPIQVAHNFREFFALSDNCRFGGTCLHRNEPNCAVLEALERDEISDIRYENYLQILEEVEDQNYWERHTDV
jgi:ribosome biogenesis GTPase / thiamine phosphate phosphatase